MNRKPIRRVLVANRGEIAVRIIRGCHQHGAEAVAVYSDCDADAMHVNLADSAVNIGPSPASQSYLDIPRIIQAAQESQCDGVHPGYGFLSENAGFARAVVDAGLVWIGPPSHAMEVMASKTKARECMEDAGVPVVPGMVIEGLDDGALKEAAGSLGYPILIKASAGGGGRGMRRIEDASGVLGGIQQAMAEAEAAFGDGLVYFEKLIEGAKHIEIQVVADSHGHVVHLHERDCSVQRRNQKVVEEAPCVGLPESVRDKMAEAACNAARAVQYEGVGTVEFLWDGLENFYFLEMNTRLQVEHPVTEMVTGIDLVSAQLRIGENEPLWFNQKDVTIKGHALEFRVYAEDPKRDYCPAPGRILAYREPGGPNVRVDSGVFQGSEVPIHYDPLISKLVVWGRTREEAIRRSKQALDEYRIVGPYTSIPIFKILLGQPNFIDGTYDTGVLNELSVTKGDPEAEGEQAAIVAAAISFLSRSNPGSQVKNGAEKSNWKLAHRASLLKRGWR